MNYSRVFCLSVSRVFVCNIHFLKQPILLSSSDQLALQRPSIIKLC